MDNINRREFIKNLTKVGGVFLGYSMMPGNLTPLKNILNKIDNTKTDLAVVRFSNPETITRKAIELLGGMNKFVSKNDIVVIKPNIGWDRTPEQAANTNPIVVETLIKMSFDAGAKKVKVFDRTCNHPRRCYINSGIEEIAKKAGAEVFNIENKNFVKVNIKGTKLKNWPIYRDILECNTLINVPIAKHHSSAILTVSMKNWMGVIGGNRGMFHLDLHRYIADLSTAIKPKLIVVDAVRILVKNGPSGGNLEDVKTLNTVIAGTNPVATDSYTATLFGKKGEDIDYIKYAYQLELGEMDMNKLNITHANLK